MASRPGKHRVWAVGERVHAHVTELHLFYNHLTASAAAHEPFDLRLLPLDEAWRRELVRLPWPTKLPPGVLGDASSALRALIREHLYITLFRACAESLASENASRLAAMQRAEKNIDELLETLHGSFHHLRQSSIDEELFDVIAGFEALKRGPRRAAAPTAPSGYKGPFLE